MVDRRADGHCERLLHHRRLARYWDAVLLSAGGNDLIAAAAVPLADGDGAPTPASLRLLHSIDEVGPARAAADWVSEAGWALLAEHLRASFAAGVVIAGCTEIPVALAGSAHLEVPLIDSTDVLAHAVVDWAFSGSAHPATMKEQRAWSV